VPDLQEVVLVDLAQTLVVLDDKNAHLGNLAGYRQTPA
jgi:hypothetical protein